ncbi:MAG: cupin domain-containing protein [Firmicutes bacterium]|nr:cupin domain-containing protein [Dethiobacter sp.]MBS3888057.1 cupin domain-containing protein [Bacillota bacterium]MBS4055215.1 cupin domain-containing protein [Thermaerobacter sp.]
MEHKSENIRGQVLCTATLADYQAASVVSRTLINKKIGTVTFFAFAAGQGLSEHTAPYDAMVQVLEGEAEVTISGQPLCVREGEMIIMPAHEPHALQAVTQFKMLLTMIRA